MVPLRNQEFETFSLFELTPDLVCIAGKDGFFRKINAAVVNKLGYTEAELFARPVSSFIHPDDKEETRCTRAALLNGTTLLNFQNRYITKAGKIVWLEWTSVYLPDKEIVFAIAKDITIRKVAEQEIEEKYKRFKSLATHFKTTIEEDRKYMAGELHNELAQLASVVKMDIGWINTNVSDLPAASKIRIKDAMVVSDLLLETIRRISFAISPNMLDDLGLNAALKWYCGEFSILSGIPCVFESDYNESELRYEVKLDFFRICQESLSNVMYQAQATKVNIFIKNSGEQICLTIVDDGKGSEPVQQQQQGITRMRERTASIHGLFAIHAEAGKGTSICVTVCR